MEERLVRAERLASIGELAGQIGHDLRNPLSGIKNAVYLLNKKGNRLTDYERGEILKTIDIAVEDSNRIITSLVDYSSELRLKPQQCTPKSLVQQAIAANQVPDHITIVDDTKDEPNVFLDVDLMEKVFTNLIQNAIQASPQKSIIKIKSAIESSNLIVEFRDSGTGVPDKVLPKIFSPLVTTKAKGMGMGLAICKRIVDAHGGTIAVESTVGEGTTVTVVLPIQSKPDPVQMQAVDGFESNGSFRSVEDVLTKINSKNNRMQN